MPAAHLSQSLAIAAAPRCEGGRAERPAEYKDVWRPARVRTCAKKRFGRHDPANEGRLSEESESDSKW